MTNQVALVTGANRGIGLEVCRQLAQQDIQVILACRDVAKGQAAAEKLGLDNITVHQLDVTDEQSLLNTKSWVQENYGRLDILVNNAGIFPDVATGDASTIDGTESSIFNVNIDNVRTAMETNLYAPLRLCQLFIPMMVEQDYGRVVNISSGMGQLSEMDGCCPGYRTSKTALNTVTRVFAAELKMAQIDNVLINSVCPGWVRTDMGGANADRDVQQGAAGIVWLATLDANGESGGFFRDKQRIEW
ncbi:SDR family oxidoreductase [Candidatus Albibeggiatoa sp. nov. NOAA]|uniref:SDR family oxidoreductase n=1 Tax=Candidatus Albibeggiatoa sp. nov. NOAA TaxID=3162724 RepID=UPI0033017041|nr:SDR family oxidoreductase [Thiotrichaceae bacterium]